LERLEKRGIPVSTLKEGVLEKLASTRTPQPVLAVAPAVVRPKLSRPGEHAVVVAVGVSDPGDLGTIVRSAEAAGADGVVVCGGTVDAQSPKVVRASAGAIFGVPIVEAVEAAPVLSDLVDGGRRCIGAAVTGGAPYDTVALDGPVAIVV